MSKGWEACKGLRTSDYSSFLLLAAASLSLLPFFLAVAELVFGAYTAELPPLSSGSFRPNFL